MKKLFVFTTAVLLAIFVYFGVKNFNYDFSFIADYFSDDSDNADDDSDADATDVEVELEENLTYDQRIEKGNYYSERGFLSLAVSEYVKAANLEPNRTEPYFKLLEANFDLSSYDKARRNVATILQLDPSSYEAKFKLLLIDIKQSQFDDARGRLAEFVIPEGETPDVNLTYYQALLHTLFDEHDQAKDLLKIVSNDSDTELAKKAIFFLSGYDEFTFAQAAEKLYLDELLARSFNQVGEYEMAINKLKKILRQRPDLRDAWNLLGFSYLNLQKNYFALTAFEKAYEIDPEFPTTQYFLGLTYGELEQTSDAIIYYNYALSNGFEPAIVLKSKLADLYLDIQDYEKSVNLYVDILDYSKDDITAFVRPVWLYLDFLNQPKSALKLAEMAVIAFPDNAMSYNLLGWSQTGVQNYVEAEKNLKKSIALDSTAAAPNFNLGKLYLAQNRKTDATNSFQKAYDLDKNGSIGQLALKHYNDLISE